MPMKAGAVPPAGVTRMRTVPIRPDTAPVAIALEGVVTLAGPEGEREAPAAALYRDDGIDYLAKNTPNTEADCTDSINRYFVMPSQATAYKVGMLTILELREKAKKSLGDKFDIRQFHEVVLSNGSVPLDVLEELVDRWIKSKQAG